MGFVKDVDNVLACFLPHSILVLQWGHSLKVFPTTWSQVGHFFLRVVFCKEQKISLRVTQLYYIPQLYPVILHSGYERRVGDLPQLVQSFFWSELKLDCDIPASSGGLK